MRASVTTLAGLGLAAWLGGCTVGSFDLGRGTSTAVTPASAPAATPPEGRPTGHPLPSHTAQEPAAPAPPPQATAYPPASAASPAAAPPPAYQPPQAQQQRPLPALRATRAPDIPPTPPAEPDPDVMTTQRARELCWMASENTKFARNLDQKVKYVEKCVNDKMRAAGQ